MEKPESKSIRNPIGILGREALSMKKRIVQKTKKCNENLVVELSYSAFSVCLFVLL